MLDVVPLFAQLRESLATALQDASSQDQALEALDAWEAELDASEPLLSSIEQASIRAHLGGVLFVEATELPEDKSLSLADPDYSPFFDMPFTEAIEYFRKKEILSPEEYERLTQAAKSNAFTARRLLSEYLRKTAHGALLRSLETGSTFADFAETLRSSATALGMEPEHTGYLRTVYQTNILAAYGEGKRQAALSPVVAKAKPYVVRLAIGDGRTRDNHIRAHGHAALKDSALGASFMSLWGFQCRCSFFSVSEDEAIARGYTLTDTMPDGAGPDPDFG